LAYADDAALLSDDLEAAGRKFQRFKTSSQHVGLQVNTKKTFFMAVGTPDDAPTPDSLQSIERCTKFTYLGAEMASSREAFLARRRLAWIAARKLYQLFQSAARDEVKMLFYTAVVEPVFLYGAESWVMDTSLAEEVDCAQRSLLRYCLNIKWPAVISNKDLVQRSQVKPASVQLLRRRLLLLGSTVRNSSSGGEPTPLAMVLQTPSTGPYRSHKSKKIDLRELMERDVKSLGITWNDARRRAIHASTWESFIDSKLI
jgi:hypothetical protein